MHSQGRKATDRLPRLAGMTAAVRSILELLGLWTGDTAALIAEMRTLALSRQAGSLAMMLWMPLFIGACDASASCLSGASDSNGHIADDLLPDACKAMGASCTVAEVAVWCLQGKAE